MHRRNGRPVVRSDLEKLAPGADVAYYHSFSLEVVAIIFNPALDGRIQIGNKTAEVNLTAGCFAAIFRPSLSVNAVILAPADLPVRVDAGSTSGDLHQLVDYVQNVSTSEKSKRRIEPPNLIEVQLNSYVEFLQKDVPSSKRKNIGLQAVFKEVFPIESYDGKATLDFSHTKSASRS